MLLSDAHAKSHFNMMTARRLLRSATVVVALLPAALCAQVTLDGNRLAIPTPVSFDAGQAVPTENSDAAITAVAGWLSEKAAITSLRIEGHVTGTPTAQQLSEARALAVARALVQKGVDCKRLVVVGFGDSKPIAAPSSDPANNRIEFVNAAMRGRLIGGFPADGGGRVAGDPCEAG
jgi:OmpA-OmpF porin, OOP family